MFYLAYVTELSGIIKVAIIGNAFILMLVCVLEPTCRKTLENVEWYG